MLNFIWVVSENDGSQTRGVIYIGLDKYQYLPDVHFESYHTLVLYEEYGNVLRLLQQKLGPGRQTKKTLDDGRAQPGVCRVALLGIIGMLLFRFVFGYLDP